VTRHTQALTYLHLEAHELVTRYAVSRGEAGGAGGRGGPLMSRGQDVA
jgi:hypothetical protein